MAATAPESATDAAPDYDAIPTHISLVLRTRRIDECFFEVTVRGGLERFVSKGLDDFVYVLLPPAGRAELPISTDFTWSAYYATPEEERVRGAYYTVRRIRHDEIDLEVYLHEPAGTVSAWATTCVPGDPVALWGPRTAWEPPASTDQWLLVADETGLPAVARIAESLPPNAEVRAFVLVPHAGATRDLGIDTTWLLRSDGCDDGSLVDAVSRCKVGGNTYAFGGGESHAVTAIRRYLRDECGLAQEQVSMTGYWRRND